MQAEPVRVRREAVLSPYANVGEKPSIVTLVAEPWLECDASPLKIARKRLPFVQYLEQRTKERNVMLDQVEAMFLAGKSRSEIMQTLNLGPNRTYGAMRDLGLSFIRKGRKVYTDNPTYAEVAAMVDEGMSCRDISVVLGVKKSQVDAMRQTIATQRYRGLV